MAMARSSPAAFLSTCACDVAQQNLAMVGKASMSC